MLHPTWKGSSRPYYMDDLLFLYEGVRIGCIFAILSSPVFQVHFQTVQYHNIDSNSSHTSRMSISGLSMVKYTSIFWFILLGNEPENWRGQSCKHTNESHWCIEREVLPYGSLLHTSHEQQEFSSYLKSVVRSLSVQYELN